MASPKAAAKQQPGSAANLSADRTEEIRRRAYELYLRRGEKDGSELEDWLEAEVELREKVEQHVIKLPTRQPG